jgi:hypothetical protein
VVVSPEHPDGEIRGQLMVDSITSSLIQNEDDASDNQLGGGWIAFIVVTVLLAVVVCGGLTAFVWYRRTQVRTPDGYVLADQSMDG